MSRTPVLSKGFAFGIILLFIGSFNIPSTAQNYEKMQPTSRSNWLYVGGSGLGNYTKIQDAIDTANEGDTVFVYSGWYNESILIDKSIVVCGEDRNTTFIIGGNTSDIVRIDDTSAEFKRFTIQGPQDKFLNGIYISNCWSTNICENFVKSCEYGILIVSSESLLVSNNTILDCFYSIENVITGNVTITENRIVGNGKGFGIEVQGTIFKNYIIRNSITNNSIGINLLFTLFTVVQQNNFLENQYQAFFISSFFSAWKQNYWNQSRLLPKLILGQFGGMVIHRRIPFFNFDWRPAQDPYDIDG